MVPVKVALSSPKWRKVIPFSGLPGPKISYGFVLEKFQKGNFLGHPVLVVYTIKALFGRI